MQDLTHAFQTQGILTLQYQTQNTKLLSCPFIYYYRKYNTSFNKPDLQMETMMYQSQHFQNLPFAFPHNAYVR